MRIQQRQVPVDIMRRATYQDPDGYSGAKVLFACPRARRTKRSGSTVVSGLSRGLIGCSSVSSDPNLWGSHFTKFFSEEILLLLRVIGLRELLESGVAAELCIVVVK